MHNKIEIGDSVLYIDNTEYEDTDLNLYKIYKVSRVFDEFIVIDNINGGHFKYRFVKINNDKVAEICRLLYEK